jgi:hypothetical protein
MSVLPQVTPLTDHTIFIHKYRRRRHLYFKLTDRSVPSPNTLLAQAEN